MKSIRYAVILIILSACKSNKEIYDASGAFEAVETIISAEASGRIKSFNIEEGQTLKAGDTIGYIDSVPLVLQKQQLHAQIRAVLSQKPDVSAQVAALQVQLQHAQLEQNRTENLVKGDAATPQQLDNATAQVDMIQKQIAALQSSLNINTSSLSQQATPIKVQIQQIDDQLSKCVLTNHVSGTVLTKYAETNEVAAVGKPLYKIASLDTIILRAYISGDQIPHIKIGQAVKVLVDDTENSYKTYNGTIEWVSDKAEFTPKTIQTKDERANLVYAIKVSVKNDGYLKIGMYGEVKL